MIHLELDIQLHYTVLDARGADFIFNIQAARTAAQRVLREKLAFTPVLRCDEWLDAEGSRLVRVHADEGAFSASYSALVEIEHQRADPASLREVPVRSLPTDVLPYLYPSRYCPSDRLVTFALREFGDLAPGYARVLAIRDWVQSHVRFTSNTSSSATTALDTLVERVGVCRDFAHLMIALCRALNLPARMATGTDYGADPVLGPPDFHAYVEVYLGDRWYIFDASGTSIPMGFLRFGTGQDAGQVAFATIFGAVQSQAPVIETHALEDKAAGVVTPVHTDQALSTATAAMAPAVPKATTVAKRGKSRPAVQTAAVA